jgi:hypothetical protein
MAGHRGGRAAGMVFLGLPVICETIVQALRVPLGSVSVSGSWPAARAWASLPPGTPSGHLGSPPPPTASRHVLGRAATPQLGAGPTPLIGLRGGCNGLIALLLGLLAADALGRHFLLHPLHSQFGKSASRDPHAGSPHPWRAAHGPIWSGGSDPAGTPRQEPRRRGRYAGRSLTPSTITLLLASATGHDRFGIISGT